VFDWQTIAVALIIAGALFYVARRGLRRLSSFRANGRNAAACASGCGKCGEEARPAARPANVLVQIDPKRRG
jgi:hypothetical protein